jgi:hypothetical protein
VGRENPAPSSWLPQYQPWLGQVSLAGPARFLDAGEPPSRRLLAELARTDGIGTPRRIRRLRAEHVVEAPPCKITAGAKASFNHGGLRAERHPIVVANGRFHGRFPVEPREHRFVSALRGRVRGEDEVLPRMHATRITSAIARRRRARWRASGRDHLNELNAGVPLFLREETRFAISDVPASPLQRAYLVAALPRVCEFADGLDDLLDAKFGGRRVPFAPMQNATLQ